jgi:hypothetical protein
MRGRLERQIRLLPQVLSCSVTSDDVVVLVAPTAESVVVESQVRAVLEGLGATMGIRVLGGFERPATSLFRIPLPSNPVVRGALVASGAAAALVLVAGVTGVEVPKGPGARPPAIAATASGGFSWLGDLKDLLRPGPVVAVAHIDTPAGQTLTASTAGTHATGRVAHPAAVPKLVHAVTPTTSCQGPPDRGAPRPIAPHSNGGGPPPWSRSVLVPPHDLCEHGRP